jgi:hypothetical protein
MYVSNTAKLLESFANRESGKKLRTGSLNTVELPNGNVALLSYDWARIAEVTRFGDVVIYDGHRGVSRTTTRHINRVTEYFSDYDAVFNRKTAPIDNSIPETIQYVDQYVGDYYESPSAVESLATDNVRSTMRRRLSNR